MICKGHARATEMQLLFFLLYNYSLSIDLYLTGFYVYLLYFTIKMFKKLNKNSALIFEMREVRHIGLTFLFL